MRSYKENGIKNVNEEYLILVIQRIIVIAFLIVIGNYKGMVKQLFNAFLRQWAHFQWRQFYHIRFPFLLKRYLP